MEKLYPVGKLRLIVPGETVKKFDLWGERLNDKGHLRVADVCKALDWDTVDYIDPEGYRTGLAAYPRGHGQLAGLSTSIFEPEDFLVVVGSKNNVVKSNLDTIGDRLMDERSMLPAADQCLGNTLLEENGMFQKLIHMREQALNYLSDLGGMLEGLSKVPCLIKEL